MTRYALIFNLNRCVRCRTCYIACKWEHGIPFHPRDEAHPREYYRLRYVSWEWGSYPDVRRAHIPIICMHCDDPLCIDFCPTQAIVKRGDGIVYVDKERCNGCGVCVHVCPYGALYIGPNGKADGCDLCVDRVDSGLEPRCVEECPARAIIFGDLDDEKGHVHRLVSSGEARPLLLDGVKGTSVYYVPSRNERWDELPRDMNFLKALGERKRDLPPIKGLIRG